MTITDTGRMTGTWLDDRQIERILRAVGINTETDRQTVTAAIKSITEAAQQEQEAFPNAELSQAITIHPHATWDGWGDSTPLINLQSVVNVMASKLLQGAVRRRKHRAMSDAAIIALNRFVRGGKILYG